MSEHQTQPEQEPDSQAQVLRQFAEQYLVPKIMALQRDPGVAMDFIDRLALVLPDVMPPLVEACSTHPDLDVRWEANTYSRDILSTAPEVFVRVLDNLLGDPDENLAYSIRRQATSLIAKEANLIDEKVIENIETKLREHPDNGMPEDYMSRDS